MKRWGIVHVGVLGFGLLAALNGLVFLVVRYPVPIADILNDDALRVCDAALPWVIVTGGVLYSLLLLRLGREILTILRARRLGTHSLRIGYLVLLGLVLGVAFFNWLYRGYAYTSGVHGFSRLGIPP